MQHGKMQYVKYATPKSATWNKCNIRKVQHGRIATRNEYHLKKVQHEVSATWSKTKQGTAWKKCNT